MWCSMAWFWARIEMYAAADLQVAIGHSTGANSGCCSVGEGRVFASTILFLKLCRVVEIEIEI